MKILFITHRFYPDIGGIEVNSEILAKAFHHAGHTVRLITWSKDHSGKKFAFPVKRNPTVMELFNEHRWADLVYENNPCLRLAWPSLLLNKPSVVAIRTLVSRPDGQLKWQDKLKFKWLKRARSVIAVSDFIRRTTWPDATVIGNPYRSDIFRLDSGSPRDNNFVFLGRLVSDKGADIAIKALHQLLNAKSEGIIPKCNHHMLTIVGDGPDRAKLEGLVRELGITNKVKFTGALTGTALVSCLNQHKVILVPSLWEEPFGNVALEGMACGCVPIVSNGGGLPEAVGQAGLVFSKGDVNALTHCMRKVLNDESIVTRLRHAAQDHLLAHKPDVVAAKYLEVIQTAKPEMR